MAHTVCAFPKTKTNFNKQIDTKSHHYHHKLILWPEMSDGSLLACLLLFEEQQSCIHNYSKNFQVCNHVFLSSLKLGIKTGTKSTV